MQKKSYDKVDSEKTCRKVFIHYYLLEVFLLAFLLNYSVEWERRTWKFVGWENLKIFWKLYKFLNF